MLVVPSLLLPPVTSRACSTQISHDVTSRRPHRLSTGRDELAAGVVVPALLQVCQVLHLAGLGVAGHCAQVGPVGLVGAASHHILVPDLHATGSPEVRDWTMLHIVVFPLAKLCSPS